MRRLTSCIGIGLLTLLVNGWGVLLAAALCPHSGFNQSAATTTVEERGCHAKTVKPESGHKSHQSSHDAERVVVKLGQSATLIQRAGSCGHCVSQNQIPATLTRARELNVKKVELAQEQASAPVIAAPSPNFAPQFIPTQHAPPIASNRKHLLLGVFLI
jgi:hypothetical protein